MKSTITIKLALIFALCIGLDGVTGHSSSSVSKGSKSSSGKGSASSKSPKSSKSKGSQSSLSSSKGKGSKSSKSPSSSSSKGKGSKSSKSPDSSSKGKGTKSSGKGSKSKSSKSKKGGVGSKNCKSSVRGSNCADDEQSSTCQSVIFDIVENVSGTRNFDDDSAQQKALTWLLQDAEVNGCDVENEVIERYALSTLYFSTNGEAWKNSDGWLSEFDVCTGWHGIICPDATNIEEISLCKYSYNDYCIISSDTYRLY